MTWISNFVRKRIHIKKGVIVKQFTSNFPGNNWLKLFTKRHNLTERFALNVKSACSKIFSNVTNCFFNNGDIEAGDDVPISNIYNF